MSTRYLNNGKINVNDLRHDIISLIKPFDLSMTFINTEKHDQALQIQIDILKQLKQIALDLKDTPQTLEVEGQ